MAGKDKQKPGTPLGKGYFGGLEGWADGIADSVRWREQAAEQDKRKK